MTTIAIASDLHSHPIVAGQEPESFLTCDLQPLPWKRNPIEALKRRISTTGITADVLLCPGDLANRCSPQGMVTAWTSVNELGETLRAQRVIATLGNHDVDSHRLHGDNAFAIARRVGGHFPLDEPVAAGEYWAKHFSIVRIDDTRLLVLNSVASHTNKADALHGLISDATLEALEESLGKTARGPLNIALVHHHPHLHEDIGTGAGDLMHGGQRLIDVLSNHGFSLIVHGHKHHPKISYAQGGAASPAVFAAGSLTHINKAGLATNTRNLFHMLDVRPSRTAGCMVEGVVHSWEFNWMDGWNQSTVRSAGFPSIAGFGCRVPPEELASRIVPLIGSSLVEWPTIEARLPELRYVLPQDKERLLRHLVNFHAVAVLPPDTSEVLLLKGPSEDKAAV
jgi:3',5'-cyclic AMP phosphodiesterase CpdA